MRPDRLTSGQGDRLKTAIFPESHPDLSTVSTPNDNQTNIQRLVAPSHLLKQSVTNLLQYKVSLIRFSNFHFKFSKLIYNMFIRRI